MGLAAKMYVKDSMTVRAVHLPDDVDLDDIQVLTEPAEWDVTFWFVTDSAQLESDREALQDLWRGGRTFWVFYPKSGHRGTDLGRDRVFALMNEAGMRGSRQVGIDDRWSCLYYKPKPATKPRTTH